MSSSVAAIPKLRSLRTSTSRPREVVFVTNKCGMPRARTSASASGAPGINVSELYTTPSMSNKSAFIYVYELCWNRMHPQQPALQQPAKIQLSNTADYREAYANSVQVRVSLWDFFLSF